MRLPTFRARTVAPHRRVRGRAGLIVGLHGYGSDETQLDALVPLDLPIVTVAPRAPHRVEPGWGWWTPRIDPTAGHRATEQRDPVPHVIDRAQVAVVERHLSRSLIEGNPAGDHPARRPDRGADTR